MAHAGRGVTVKDVARQAGVSITSVSNFLNNRMGEMSDETRQRIAEAIQSLGYHPNSVARQLKTGKTPILGLLLPTVVNPYFGELAVALDVEAQKRGFRVILCNTQRQSEREFAFVQELVAYGVRGILAGSVLENTDAMGLLIEQGVAFVLFEAFGEYKSIDRVDVVSMDNEKAMELAVAQLAALGHRSLAYVTATPLTPHRVARMQGFQSSCRKHGIESSPVITDQNIIMHASSHNDADLAMFGRAVARHITTMQPRPTGVVAMNDLVALGMLAAFQAGGVNLPQDMSIIGIDDIQLAEFSYPALTSVRQPYEEIAQAAIERICARLHDPELPGRTLFLPPRLMVRDSAQKPGTPQ